VRDLVVLLVSFGMLALATAASVQCAWVLWVEAPAGSKQWSVATWVHPPRFTAKEHCEAARTTMNAMKAIDGRMHSLVSEANDAYSCLPDTVDPCKPKGE
jgi:hypothetical protein